MRSGDAFVIACPECRELFYERGRFETTWCVERGCGAIGIVLAGTREIYVDHEMERKYICLIPGSGGITKRAKKHMCAL